jgi:hypothetical protein
MQADHDILPHGDFKQVDERLWTLDGELPHHSPLTRSMTVYKMKDGGLWIHSAIALNDETQKKLESLGHPTYLVVPNTMHRMDAAVYKKSYPDLKVFCPRAAISKVEEVVKVDDACENFFITGEIEALSIDGAKPIELAYELDLGKGKGKALVMCDLLVNVTDVRGVGGLLLKLTGRVGFFRTPPLTKLILLKQRKAFKNWLWKQSNKLDLKVITVSHGKAIRGNIRGLLRQAASEV